MALIQFGSIVHAASGALGGVTFSRQGGAPIVRVRPIWRPGSSEAVLAQQALFAQARAEWRELTDDERLTWTRLAAQFSFPNRLGLHRQLSPFAIFVGAAVRNLHIGFPIFHSPETRYTDLLGRTVTLELWPGGPATITLPDGSSNQLPHHTVRAQRLFSAHPGLPGQLWHTISYPFIQQFSTNFWPELIAALGTPARLEYIRFEVEQWLPTWPRTITTRYLLQVPNVGDELITNGDFQTGGTPPAGWQVLGTGVLTIWSGVTYGDNWSGKWTVAAAQPITRAFTATASYFSLVGGAPYTFRFAYRFNSGTVSYVQLLGAGMSNITLYTNLTDATAKWIVAHAHFTPDGNATGCYLRFYNAANIAVNVDLDNVSIRKDTP
jgi:hypothetical protein